MVKSVCRVFCGTGEGEGWNGAAQGSEGRGEAMRHVHTCPLCEALCGIESDVVGGKVHGVRGNPRDVFSRGHICPKALALQDLHEDPDRLRVPMRREGDRWVEVSWEAAIDEVVARLSDVRRRHGRHAVATYIGNPAAHNYRTLLAYPIFHGALGSRSGFSATSVDQLPHMFAAYTMFGHQLLLPVPDVDRTHTMVILGGNPAVSNGSIMTAPGITDRLKAIRARGGRLIVIDPRLTRTAKLADQHLFIRPGTDALLLLALLHVVFEEDRVADGPWRAWTDGVALLRDACASWTPECVEETVGITAEEIRALARVIADAPSAAVYGRLGLTTQRFGGLAAWLLVTLNVVTGNLDRPGGMMFASPAADFLAAAAMANSRGSYARWRSRVSGLPEFGGELPASVLAEEIETPGPGQIRALVTIAGNPVLSTPNGGRLAAALDGLDFMVSLDMYLTATTRRADLVIPPLSPLERDHFGLAFHALAVRNTVKYSAPVLPAADGARDDWETMLELAVRLGRTRGGRKGIMAEASARLARRLGPQRLLDMLLRRGPEGRNGMRLARLRDAPDGIDLGPLRPSLPGRLWHPTKRVVLAPAELLGDLPRLKAAFDAGELGGREGLLLIGRRQLRSNNSWLHNSERLVKGKRRCTLLLHPDDAGARGLEEGDLARVTSRVGEVQVPVSLDDGIMPGVVSLPHGWGHRAKGARMTIANATEGVSLNDLTDETHVDTLTGTAGFSAVSVSVEAGSG